MALVDALGNLVRFVIPGQRNDIMGVRPLIDGITFDALLADKPVLSLSKGLSTPIG